MHLSTSLRRIANLLRQAAPEAEFYVTYNREKQKGLGDVLPRLDDADKNLMQREFRRTVIDEFSKKGIEVIPKDTVGVWKGKIEPSTLAKVQVDSKSFETLKTIAANLGWRYDQDGVLIFVNDGGDDVKYVFPHLSMADRQEVFNLMRKNGLSGATFLKENGGRLVMFGIRRWGDLPKMTRLLRAMLKKNMDAMPVTYSGSVVMVERNDYDELRD